MKEILDWFEVMSNRRKVYLFMAACGPLLFLLGFVTPDAWQTWLEAVAPILLFGGGTLAANNSKEQ